VLERNVKHYARARSRRLRIELGVELEVEPNGVENAGRCCSTECEARSGRFV